ncbi:multivesicular body subunit 12B isoform X3 [Dama dama]|uniref:multivesicular body subunit 12B isoform X3 n=1 Tax=Dama dama TaxID=30532 RepID=UPI002A361B8A|nr:multivesicular body subunit 12B isoform X3 [Dama dama]
MWVQLISCFLYWGECLKISVIKSEEEKVRVVKCVNAGGICVLVSEGWSSEQVAVVDLSLAPSGREEVAFRKKRLCIKFIPRDSTEAAICDIRIMGRTKQAPPQYTFIGELNSMGIWYRMGRVPRSHDASQPTTPSPSSAASTPAPNLPRHISLTLPATFRGRNSTRADYEYQHSNLYAISAMDGVPFMISEKFSCVPESMQPFDLLGITIKSLAEIEKEYEYSFRTEQSAAARLPPSPTRCQQIPQS